MKYLYLNKHWKINEEYNIDKLLYLMIDRPNRISSNIFVWYNNKNWYHRSYDLPAETMFSLYWFKYGKYHRERSKPAIIYSNGDKLYYINGELIKNEYLK